MMPTIITVAVARLAGGFQLADFTTELRDVIGHFAFRAQISLSALCSCMRHALMRFAKRFQDKPYLLS